MADAEVVLSTLAREFPVDGQDAAFLNLYKEDPPLNAIFANFHGRLNGLFNFLNVKQARGGHYNADQSRELIDLVAEIRDVRTTLARVGIKMELRADYQSAVDECSAFLVPSGGSPIPDGFTINIDRFDPVFSTPDDVARPDTKEADAPKPVMVGQGSFANVYKYVDSYYGFNVALKVAKRDLLDRDLERFRKEYAILKSLRFPYIVEVYAYDESKNRYTMEFCDTTLDEYIKKNNDKMWWSTRKRIALQFLYGINYLHSKQVMHRDISRRNVLVKLYDRGAVVVKLSDFGLYKGEESEYTKVDSSLKGTIIDPTLSTFKDFNYTNDIYAVGLILSFIFTGKVPLNSATGAVQPIVAKCTDHIVANRYGSVAEIIAEVDALPAPETPNASETPA
jgi:tRNA A-37 threonylcarbamoyl transferase component Bud32